MQELINKNKKNKNSKGKFHIDDKIHLMELVFQDYLTHLDKFYIDMYQEYLWDELPYSEDEERVTFSYGEGCFQPYYPFEYYLYDEDDKLIPFEVMRIEFIDKIINDISKISKKYGIKVENLESELDNCGPEIFDDLDDYAYDAIDLLYEEVERGYYYYCKYVLYGVDATFVRDFKGMYVCKGSGYTKAESNRVWDHYLASNHWYERFRKFENDNFTRFKKLAKKYEPDKAAGYKRITLRK